MARVRLDAELVRRGLARSREHARELVAAGRVLVGEITARKPAMDVGSDASVPGPRIVLVGDRREYVSRAGHKLAGALEVFGPRGLTVAGRRCLDAGASTGGFTQVLLEAGAAEVVAVDVGHGQLVESLRTDPRVRAYDGINIRDLAPPQVGGPAELLVADLSFISLRLVLPALRGLVEPDGDMVVLVKPQFEVGRERLGSGGVVRSPALRVEAVRGVVDRAAELGLGVAGLVPSTMPGASGNREYLLWLRADAPAVATTDPGDPRERNTDMIGELIGEEEA